MKTIQVTDEMYNLPKGEDQIPTHFIKIVACVAELKTKNNKYKTN